MLEAACLIAAIALFIASLALHRWTKARFPDQHRHVRRTKGGYPSGSRVVTQLRPPSQRPLPQPPQPERRRRHA